MPHYDFIEIGTSDFDTLIQTCKDDAIGLSIEPIKMYIDKLPDKKNVKKLNIAVSSHIGEIKVFYIKPEIIEKYKLMECLRGCNTINNYHPAALYVVKDMHKLNPDEIFTIDTVQVKDIKTVFMENNVEGCTYFKVDTEGHDCVILNSLFDYCEHNNNCLPKKILFESNHLTPVKDVDAIVDKAIQLGYIVQSRGHDTVLIKQ